MITSGPELSRPAGRMDRRRRGDRQDDAGKAGARAQVQRTAIRGPHFCGGTEAIQDVAASEPMCVRARHEPERYRLVSQEFLIGEETVCTFWLKGDAQGV